jgi:hypothetical protein
MSELQQAADLCNQVFDESRGLRPSTGKPMQVRTGRVGSEFIEASERLSEWLDGLSCSAGWQQYQSGVVRPGECPSDIVVDHAEYGRLLDAELCAEDGRSLTIRHTGDGWLVAHWQPGEGDEWLADFPAFRALGGGRLEYLRLWQTDRRGELKPASAWLSSVAPASNQESSDE